MTRIPAPIIFVLAAFWSILADKNCRAADYPIPEVVQIPAGSFVFGSDASEREAAYRLDAAAYGHDRTRELAWYEQDRARKNSHLEAYAITLTPITNAQYAAFVKATGHPAPDVDVETWRSYGLIHPFERTRRYAWQNGQPSPALKHHPVVLVSHADARAYAEWLGAQTGGRWRLPTELEWEKAARGTDGRMFPWGETFDAERLNSHDLGPFATTDVGRYPSGASPFGLLDVAGQVFEWTDTENGGRYIVKGGSWDDKGCGICRPAARHGRPAHLKHILIGFRLVRE